MEKSAAAWLLWDKLMVLVGLGVKQPQTVFHHTLTQPGLLICEVGIVTLLWECWADWGGWNLLKFTKYRSD